MPTESGPDPKPEPKKPRRPLPAKAVEDGLEFGVSEPCGVRLPQFDGWPELGEPPVLIEPYGVRVYRLDTAGLGADWWPADRPHSRQWVYDVSGATRAFDFKEIDRLVPEATRAARAAATPPAAPPAG